MPSVIARAGPVVKLRTEQGVAVHHWILGTVVVGSLLLYVYMTARFGHASAVADAHLYYTHAHSWYFDGDCDYEDDIRESPKLAASRAARDFYLGWRAPTGRVVNYFPCGWSVVALPFVAAADGLTALHNAVFQASIARDGHTAYFNFIVPLGQVLVGLAGLLAAYAVAARYFSKVISALAVALVWMGTNVGYFISFEPTMSHAASLGFVSLMIYAADTIRRTDWSLARAVGLGLSCGMMTAVRHQNFVWSLVPVILLGVPLISALIRRESGACRRSGLACVAAAVAALCLVPQVVVNLSTYGAVAGNVLKYAPDWRHPQFTRDLIEWPTGLLTLYPLSAICLLGAACLVWEHRRSLLAYALLTGFGAMVYINACAAVGPSRRYANCAIVFVLGLAATLRWAYSARWRSILVGALLATVCLKNVAMILLADRGFVSRYIFTAAPHDAPDVVGGIVRLLTSSLPT